MSSTFISKADESYATLASSLMKEIKSMETPCPHKLEELEDILQKITIQGARREIRNFVELMKSRLMLAG